MTLLITLLACSGEPETPDVVETTQDVVLRPPQPVITTDSGYASTAGTGDTAPAPVLTGCDVLPALPTEFTTINIQTEEDFDFDADGYIIRQDGSNMLATNIQQDNRVISANIGSDIAGIRVLSTGAIVYADHSTGAIWRINADGSKERILGNLNTPNGFALDQNEILYFTEFKNNGTIRFLDPVTGDTGIIASNLDYPNGLEFGPNDDKLYVAVNPNNARPKLFEVASDDQGGWLAPVQIFEGSNNTLLDTVTTDVCGNVYTVDYRLGAGTADVHRISNVTGEAEQFGSLTGNGWPEFNAMRWGNGVGGWERGKLYITNRQELFVFDMGIEGRIHPTSP